MAVYGGSFTPPPGGWLQEITVPGTVAIDRFYVDNDDLKVEYTVTCEPGGSVDPFTIDLYTSLDGVTPYQGPIQSESATELGNGTYTLTIQPNFTDQAYDYYLMAAIDETEGSFSDPANWTTVADDNAFNRGQRTHAGGGIGDNTATWVFDSLPYGAYDVYATWAVATGAATDAPFTLWDESINLGTCDVDQTQPPGGEPVAGQDWQLLDQVVVSNGTLTVQLGDDANGSVIADAIRIVPDLEATSNTPDIVDDGGPSQTFTGAGWTGQSDNQAFRDNYRSKAAGTGDEKATWAFSGLTSGGTYRVLATWVSDVDRATDAPYTMSDGAGLNTTVTANQLSAPDDCVYADHSWESLGTFTIGSETLTVELSDNATPETVVVADAVRVIEEGSLETLLGPTRGLAGMDINLTAEVPSLFSSVVTSVAFYLDDGDGVLSGEDDLGTDTDGSDGWSLSVPADGWTPGDYCFFAQPSTASGLVNDYAAREVVIASDTASADNSNGGVYYDDSDGDWTDGTLSCENAYQGGYRVGSVSGSGTAKWESTGLANATYNIFTTHVVDTDNNTAAALFQVTYDNNQITATSLPSSLTELTTLETLDLRYNQVAVVPEAIADLTSLSTLLLHGNPITDPGNPQTDPKTGLAELAGKLISIDVPLDDPDAAKTVAEDDAVRELAERLYKLPLKMYEYVLNTIEFQRSSGWHHSGHRWMCSGSWCSRPRVDVRCSGTFGFSRRLQGAEGPNLFA